MTARQTDKYPTGGPQAGGQPYEHWEPYDANAALRNQITRTRADLGETLSELAARADVKARARQAMSQARDRTRDVLRNQARTAVARTSSLARTGVSSARSLVDRVGRTPAAVVAGGAAGALVGLGIYALLRRRLPFQRSLTAARARMARARRARMARERMAQAAAARAAMERRRRR